MITHQVVWDGTDRHHGRYLLMEPETRRPAPAHEGPVRPIRRDSLQEAIYQLVIRQDMAAGDIVAHFKDQNSQSMVYSAIATLRTLGYLVVVRREIRVRANGAGPMRRDIYGPASGPQS